MKRKEVKEHVCVKCGKPIVARTMCRRFCDECAKEQRREVQKKYYRRKMAEKKKPPKRNRDYDEGHCLACDRDAQVNKDGFCRKCLAEGWDNVYRVTGHAHHVGKLFPSYNSHHKKVKKIRPKIVAGWRGQVVIGGGIGIHQGGW